MDLRAALEFLESHIDLSGANAGDVKGLHLDRMTRLSGVLGDPHTAFPTIHITGTNGKGSTARMLSRLLEVHDLSVGLYTSPHLERYNERLMRNSEPISDAEFASQIATIAGLESLLDGPPSHFEILTAAAFAWFADLAVDVAIVEVGLLGRFDATNIIDGDVVVVTNVGRDHTDFEGDWRANIAWEKAGIIKANSTVVLGETDPALQDVFLAEEHAEAVVRDRDFHLPKNELAVRGRLLNIESRGRTIDDVYVPVHGTHQGDNAALAVAAADAFFGRPIPDDLVHEAFAPLDLPGRFEVLERNPLLILDGAHNPDGALTTAAVLAEEFSAMERRVFVLGMLAARDHDEMLDALGIGEGDAVVATTPPSPRALPAEQLAKLLADRRVSVEVVPDVSDAVDRARFAAGPDDMILVTGSLYVVGEARAAIMRDRS